LNQDSIAILQTQISTYERFQSSDSPTRHQLFLTGLHAAIPFVGFGFLDNLLMIVWGDAIDHFFGGTFGISIMVNLSKKKQPFFQKQPCCFFFQTLSKTSIFSPAKFCQLLWM